MCPGNDQHADEGYKSSGMNLYFVYEKGNYKNWYEVHADSISSDGITISFFIQTELVASVPADSLVFKQKNE